MRPTIDALRYAGAMLRFDVLHRDETSGARLGRVHTAHGRFDTPAFMPVGTQATVKGLLPTQVAQAGARCLLANTYHLMLRPGSDLVRQQGGLHGWMRWQGSILTDSGGFQVFSLADEANISDHGVTFKSHLDGQRIDLTPERSIQVQNDLGADIIMAFDDCPPGGAEVARVELAMQRTTAWLERCVKAHHRKDDQSLFGIVQGGTHLDLRAQHASELTRLNLPGYAIGGVAVGEDPALIAQVVAHTAPLLPADRPRYLMGVGYERDLVSAVQQGVDMFDCVLPTRNGRTGNAFTPTGQLRLKNLVHRDDPAVIDPACDCPACAGGFSRSYLRHLVTTGEMLGPTLLSLHNTHHFQRLMVDIRAAISHNDWLGLSRRWPVAFTPPGGDVPAELNAFED